MAKSKSVTIHINGDPSGLDDGLGEASSSLGNFAGPGLAAFGAAAAAGMAAAAALAGAAFVKGLMDAIDNEKTYDRLFAQLGLEDGSAEAEAWGDLTGSLYAQAYGESLGDVANTAWAVSSTLEDALGTDSAAYESAIVMASDIASAYGLMAEDLVSTVGIMEASGIAGVTESFDLLAVAIGEVGPALKDDLTQAVAEYAPFAAQLGMSGDEFIGILTEMAKLGPWALDKAGDAMKEFTIRGTDMSTSSAKAYQSIGLDMHAMSNELLAGGDRAEAATDQIVAGLLGITDPAKQGEAAIALFGTPLEDLSTAQMPEFLAALASGETALGDTAGAATDLGDTLNDNLGTRIETFKRTALMGLAGFIEDNVIPGLTGIADAVGPVFGELATAFREDGVDGLVEKFKEIWPDIKSALVNFFSEKGPEIWQGLVNAVKGLVELEVELRVALLNALSSVLPAIGDWFIETAWPFIKENWQGWADAFLGWAGPLAGQMVEALWNLAQVMGHWFVETGYPFLMEEGGKMWQGLLKWLWNDAIPAVLAWAVDMAIAVADWINETGIPWMIEEGKNLFGSLLAWVTGDGKDLALEKIQEFLGVVADWLKDEGPGLISSAASGLWDGVADAFKAALNAIIRMWNDLEFQTPDVPFTEWGGQTIGTPDIPEFRAGGGPVMAGVPYTVGERGRETFIPGAAGRIAPATSFAGGGTTVVFQLGDREVMRYLIDEMGRVERSKR